MLRHKPVWATFLLAVLSSFANAAQSDLKAVKVTTPPTIDGTINEAEWKEAPFVEGLHDRATGAVYSDTGRFWLAYDKQYIYFAARLQESEPNAIHATEYRTNVSLRGDDFVELDLDLAGSLSNYNRFQINPQGATNITIAGGRAAKREWIGDFIAKSRITADGWEAEARIPWRAMAIPRGGKRDVRFNIQRFIAKNQRTLSYVYVPFTDTGLTPQWMGVELPSPEVDHSIKLLPYGYAGYDPKTKGVFNAGIDMKTAVTDQINLVGSINPDFRNIANQILSIDFSRFERLAGETRPFFQEGSQYSNTQIFAPQRISGFDAGLNTYGRINDKISFSLIDTIRFGKENDTIFNLSNNPNPNTAIRATVTDLERPGLSNKSYLVRLSQNMGDYNLFLRNMGSQDTHAGFGMESNVFLSYSKAGLGVSAGLSKADPGFRPRLGFVNEVDFQGVNLDIEYARTFNHGKISDSRLNAGVLSYDHANGHFYRQEAYVMEAFTLRPGINFMASADLANFEGSKDSLYSFQVGYPYGNPYRNLTLRQDIGREAGIAYQSTTAFAAFRLTKQLQLTLTNQHVEYAGKNDQTIFSASYDLGKDRSIAGRLVRQGNKTNAYLAYSRSGNRGVEYFLIIGDPNAQKFRNSIIFKVTAPINLG